MSEDRFRKPVGGLTSPVLEGSQASVWHLVDALFVKYGPLGLVLIGMAYYVFLKDQSIDKKDQILLKQQETVVSLATNATKTLAEATKSIEDNTRAMKELVEELKQRQRQ